MSFNQAKFLLAAMGFAVLSACDQKPVSETKSANDLKDFSFAASQAEIQLNRTKALHSVGVAATEELALSYNMAISTDAAEKVAGSLFTEYNLISRDQMNSLTTVVKKASSTGSTSIMSRPEYKAVKLDPAYLSLSEAARKKFDVLLPAGLTQDGPAELYRSKNIEADLNKPPAALTETEKMLRASPSKESLDAVRTPVSQDAINAIKGIPASAPN